MTSTVAERDMREQVLDYAWTWSASGASPVRTRPSASSMAACEGVILVVDATQGVEAQTVANTLLALRERALALAAARTPVPFPVCG